MTELPERGERRARIEALGSWIDDWLRACETDDLGWICAPHLVVYLTSRWGGSYVTEPASRQRAELLFGRERNRAPRQSTLAAGHLFLAFSANQRRSQAPIAARLGAEAPAPADLEPSQQRERELFEQSLRVLEELIAAARRNSLELPVKRRRLYQIVLGAARDLAWWETVLAAVAPRSVVIGSTHSFASRSLALAARRAGVPSVYIPHASVLGDPRLCDLPVDQAALWGPAEAAHYAGFGADSAGMEATGHAGLELEGDRSASPPERVVYALPEHDLRVREALGALVAEALGEEVVASAHPRADRAAAEASLPAGWTLWPGRTFDLLRQHPPALVEWYSGVGLEALLFGVPTIELAFRGERSNYAFSVPPHVPLVSDAAALREAVAAARAMDERDRERLRDYARTWVSSTGSDAAQAGAELLERVANAGPRDGPVWDAWSGRASRRHQVPSQSS